MRTDEYVYRCGVAACTCTCTWCSCLNCACPNTESVHVHTCTPVTLQTFNGHPFPCVFCLFQYTLGRYMCVTITSQTTCTHVLYMFTHCTYCTHTHVCTCNSCTVAFEVCGICTTQGLSCDYTVHSTLIIVHVHKRIVH